MSKHKYYAVIAVLLIVVGILVMGGMEQKTLNHSTTSDERPAFGNTAPATTSSNSPTRKPRPRPDQNERQKFSSSVRNVSWQERKKIFQDALDSNSVSQRELWETFSELESNSSDKVGAAEVGFVIFKGFAATDPEFGIECLKKLNAGYVRRQALQGLGTAIPADYVASLFHSLTESGFLEDVRDFSSDIQSAVRSYSVEDLRRVIDLNLFDDRVQQILKGYLSTRIKLDSEHNSSEQKPIPTNQMALAQFKKSFPTNRFEAAASLQSGALDGGDLSKGLIEEIGQTLATDDPEKALTWAGNWTNKDHKASAVSAVVLSWAKMDTMSCSKYISNIQDQELRDLSAFALIQHLVKKGNLEEAKAWVGSIVDSNIMEHATVWTNEQN